MDDFDPNRRCEPRFYLPLDVHMDDCTGVSDTLENVSLRGCCIDSSQQYEPSGVMLVHFSDMDDTFCMPGKVKWKSGSGGTMHRYGIEFINSQSPFFLDQRETFIKVICNQMRLRHRKKTTTRMPVVSRNNVVAS